jgi:hypothetical protein
MQPGKQVEPPPGGSIVNLIGGKLVALTFPETRAQRFGDTVVLYGSYDATIVRVRRNNCADS